MIIIIIVVEEEDVDVDVDVHPSGGEVTSGSATQSVHCLFV